MSNSLAIATVTFTLGSLMSRAAQALTGTDVTTIRPGAPPPPAINLYLFQILPNSALRNVDLPTRGSGGDLLQRPQAAFDLRYLISFYGDDTNLEPQRLMGSAVSVLHTYPVLSREMIRSVVDAAVAGDPNHFLRQSNLDEQVELVRLTPLSFTLDDLSKLWSVFFQTPYILSVVYQASVVLIEETVTPQRGLPVRGRGLQVAPINQPVIERVVSVLGVDQPILAESEVLIHGKRLNGAVTRILFGEIEMTPAADDITEGQISLTLPDGLQAGVQGVQVAHLLSLGDPPTLHRGVSSNVIAFVLRPQIKKTGNVYQITFSGRTVAGDGTLSGKVTVRLNPDIGETQRAVLLLNPFQPTPPPGTVYVFDAEPRTIAGEAVEFLISAVRSGDYLVRIQVDGAESALEVDSTPGSPTVGMYVTPKVAIV